MFQTAIMELWAARKGVVDERHLRNLLWKRLRSRCADKAERDALFQTIPIDDKQEGEPSGKKLGEGGCVSEDKLPEARPIELGLSYDVKRAVTALPPLARRIILMLIWDGLTQHEIAQLLSISRDKVARQSEKSFKALRMALAAYEPPRVVRLCQRSFALSYCAS